MVSSVPRPSLPLRPRSGRLGRQLRLDHRELESDFADLHRRGVAGDWHDLNAVWSDFGERFETHMKFEEEELFPVYVRHRPEAATEVAELKAEHGAIRALLDQLALEIQLHEIRAHTVDAFIERIEAHAKRENERFYAWASTL